MKPSPSSRPFAWRLAIGLLILAPVCLLHAGDADDRLMIQSVDMTKEGRRLTAPSPANPTYFIPVFEGYKELGGVSDSYENRPRDENEIARQLLRMLEKQGYRLASKQFPPKIVLVFRWGSVVPVDVPTGRDGSYTTNASEIRAYVVGDNYRDLDQHSALFPEMTNLHARHYLLISAFEFRNADQKGEVLLWRAHVTTELWGNYLEETLPTMIAHAAPIVGREIKPGGAWSPRIPHVIIGKPEVVRDEPEPKEKK